MVAVDEMMYYTLSLGRAVRDLKNVGKYLAGLNLTEAALCILSVLDEDQFPESIWRFDFMMSLSPRFHGESMCIPHEVIDNSDLVAAIVR